MATNLQINPDKKFKKSINIIFMYQNIELLLIDTPIISILEITRCYAVPDKNISCLFMIEFVINPRKRIRIA